MVSRFGGYASFRSHVSFLPGRRIGVVAITTGGIGTLTDLLAAFAYDLEAGRSDARIRAEQRFGELLTRSAAQRRSVAAEDSARAVLARVPLRHPLRAYVRTYTLDGFASIFVEQRAQGLHYRWGAVSGPVMRRDGADETFLIELAGADTPVTFEHAADGVASAMLVDGTRFARPVRSGR